MIPFCAIYFAAMTALKLAMMRNASNKARKRELVTSKRFSSWQMTWKLNAILVSNWQLASPPHPTHCLPHPPLPPLANRPLQPAFSN